MLSQYSLQATDISIVAKENRSPGPHLVIDCNVPSATSICGTESLFVALKIWDFLRFQIVKSPVHAFVLKLLPVSLKSVFGVDFISFGDDVFRIEYQEQGRFVGRPYAYMSNFRSVCRWDFNGLCLVMLQIHRAYSSLYRVFTTNRND